MEAPECPICLQDYEGAAVIPRVLACGHSACEECLSQLPRPFSLPAVVRCPSCTQIVHFPEPLGAAALPKNIDLLRISLLLLDDKRDKPSTSKTPPKQQIARRRRFASPVWSNEIYAAWKDWILPQGFVSIERGEKQVSVCDVVKGKVIGVGSECLKSASPLIRRLKEDQEVNLLKIGGSDLNDSVSVLEYSYVAKIISILSKMSDMQRRELDSVLMMSLRTQLRVCHIYALWLNDESGYLYLVSERKNGSLLEVDDTLASNIVQEEGKEEDRVHISRDDRVSGLASICLELCEILLEMHSEGFLCGCLGMSCLRLDKFRHVYVDLSELVIMGRKLRKCISTAVKCTEKIGDLQPDDVIKSISKIGVLMSPELLFELLRNEGVPVGRIDLKYTPNTSSDVWAFSCVIIRLLAGKQFTEDMFKYLSVLFQMRDGEPGYECKTLFMNWTEREDKMLEASIGAKFMSVKQTLVKCLDFNLQSRPRLMDVWRVLRESSAKSCLDEIVSLKETTDHCFVLGELWGISDECKSDLKMEQLQEGCSDSVICSGQDLASMQDTDSAKSLSGQKVASVDLQQHRDCVTGLTVGGTFLFSCSLDKTINVWSIQDFAHVHTFRGPEHRIMAVIFVKEEQPICISGDIGGGIFIWGGNPSFGQEPLKKWYEEKDWRYNGIYALAAPGNGHLYTGGGDRLIKAWSLKEDYSLLCTMEGHKSVVSSLAVCNSVLYSGSWDGTVRLWNLHDHCALAVLAENEPATVASIHSLYADNHTIVAAYEDGFVKIWVDDESKKSIQVHDGAVFAVGMEGKMLFTGGWDKTVKIQEIREDDGQLDMRQVGSIACDAVITSLVCVNGELLIGYSNGLIKVYRHEQTD